MKTLVELICAGISFFFLLNLLHAQQSNCPPQQVAMKSFHVQISGGPAFWTANLGQSSEVGFALQLQTGLDLTSWLSMEITWSSGMHSSHQEFPPSRANLAVNGMHASMKLDVPINRFELSAIAGVGILWIQPKNLIAGIGLNRPSFPSWLGGIRFLWHTYRRRISLGFQISAIGADDIPDIWIIGSGLVGASF